MEGRRYVDLERGNVGASLRVTTVHHFGGADRQQSGRLEVDVGVGNHPLNELLVLQKSTVHFARQGALHHEVKGSPHLAHAVHAVKDPSGAKALLGRFVTLTDSTENIFFGNAYIGVFHFAVVR